MYTDSKRIRLDQQMNYDNLKMLHQRNPHVKVDSSLQLPPPTIVPAVPSSAIPPAAAPPLADSGVDE